MPLKVPGAEHLHICNVMFYFVFIKVSLNIPGMLVLLLYRVI